MIHEFRRDPRALLTELYEAAVAGAAPGPLTERALDRLDIHPGQHVRLIAAGKGATAMASAAVAALRRRQGDVAAGVIVSPVEAPPPRETIASVAGDHPQPGRASFAAARRIGDVAHGLRTDDVALVLLSGGATSLIAAPRHGLREAHVGRLFELLLGAGLDIRQMNAVRKRFTRWGAGHLALALAPAHTHLLVVSDVPGDDPADVASGPCTADPWYAEDVVALLRRSGIHDQLERPLRDYLTSVARGSSPETPKPAHPAFARVATQVIGTNRLALDAMAARCGQLGMPVRRGDAPLTGDAAAAGAAIADDLLARARAGAAGVVVWGGETTVRLTAAPHHAAGADSGPLPPAGGRCQELALAAGRRLAEVDDAAHQVVLLAAGTDGRDGPTDAAGAFADASLWRRIRATGRDPALALARHESYAVLDAAGALLRRGLTGTNVMDVVIAVVQPAHAVH